MHNERLIKLRKERGLSQAQLAKIVGVDQSSIAKYEQGKQDPRRSVKIKLANFFGVTVEDLFYSFDYDCRSFEENNHKKEDK